MWCVHLEQNTVDCLKQIQNRCKKSDISQGNDIYINSDIQFRKAFIREMLFGFGVCQRWWWGGGWGGGDSGTFGRFQIGIDILVDIGGLCQYEFKPQT